jgi:hypothetical protein
MNSRHNKVPDRRRGSRLNARDAVGPNQRLDLELFRQEKLAKKLLADFCDGGSRGRRMINPYRPCNPIYGNLPAASRTRRSVEAEIT